MITHWKLVFFAILHAVSADYTELCRLFPTGTHIRMPGSCTEYIDCHDGTGDFIKCSNSLAYDSTKQNCATATSANTGYCENPCANLDGTWVANPTCCEKYFYCSKGAALSGYCYSGQHFDPVTKSCVYKSTSQCVDVNNICDLVPDKTKFRYEKDCSKYYECKSGRNTLTSCKSGLYYDVESASCLAKKLVECTAHPKDNVCLDKKKNPIVGLVADDATCRGYFRCRYYGIVEDIDPVYSQCPAGQFFNADTETCVDPTDVVCTYNRCSGRGTMLVTTSSNYCHDYIKCVDGKEVETLTCPDDMFFDETKQECTTATIAHKCCVKQK